MPIDELKELGLKVKAARKSKGLTQQGLADICHVSTKQIANIERGKMNPSFLILKAIEFPAFLEGSSNRAFSSQQFSHLLPLYPAPAESPKKAEELLRLLSK